MNTRLHLALIVSLCGMAGWGVDCRITPGTADPEINARVAAMASGDRMVFTKGTHRLARHIYVGGKKGLVFEGENGAVLELHCNPSGAEEESCGAFFLEGCERIVIKNLRVTTDNHIGNQGTVVGKDMLDHSLLYKVDPGFPVTGSEHYFQLNTVDADGVPDCALQVHEPIRKVVGVGGSKDRYVGMDYEVLDASLVRIRVPKWASLDGVTNGHRMLVRYFRNGDTPFSIVRCAGVKVQDVEIERTFALGMVVSPPSRDLLLRRFNIRPAKGSGLYAASNSDGIHILGLGGRFVMEDCHFKGLGDDALNIHSMAAEVKAIDEKGAVSLILRGPDRKVERRLPDGWAKPGDRLEIYGADYSRKGEVTLVAYDGRAQGGVLSGGDAMPEVGDLLVNRAFYPSVRISNCSVEATRARAFLLQTHDVRIENCLFRGLPMPALIFAVDFAVWNEAGPTENAVVSGCRFEKCAISRGGAALGAIVVKADHDGGENDRPAGIHRNVRFLDNTFEDCGSSGIYVAATDGVELGGNAFRRCSSNPNVEGFNRFDIRLKNCRNVRLEKNVSDRKSLVVADPPLSNVSGPAGDGSGNVGPEAQSQKRVLLDPHVNSPEALKDLRLHLGDPYVLYEDGVYYAYGSLGTDKGFTVCVSRDLKTWKMDQGRGREGRVFTKGDGYGESRFWAPECHKYRGRYYLFYSADHGCAVAVGDSPLGPFANPTKEPLVREGRYENGDAMLCIDNSLVLAENGDPWMVYSRGGRSCLVRLTEDLQHVLPETSFFLFGDLEPWQHGIEEGPYILRENNRWYCFFSGDDCRSRDYSIGVGVADSLAGPWQRIPGYRFLHRAGGLTGTGHGTPFKDATGSWRYIFHAHYSHEYFGPRCTYVSKFRFDRRSGRPELLADEKPLSCKSVREVGE